MPVRPNTAPNGPQREQTHFKTPFRLMRQGPTGLWTLDHWVHCPLCRATSNGFGPKGRPVYSGGFLVCKTERHPRGIVVACECWLGRRKGEAQQLLRYDQLAESDRALLYPKPDKAKIVNARDELVTRGPAEEPTTLAPAYTGPAPVRPAPKDPTLFGA